MHKLERLMKKVHGGTFISIDTTTVPVLKGGKSNPLQGKVLKMTLGSSVMVFQNKTTNAYENMVKRRLEAEGKSQEDFVLSPRQWGERIPNTPFVKHKDKLYLEVIFLKPGKTAFFVDGKEIPRESIQGLEREEGEQGGLENKVIIRTFNVENIRSITINKHKIIL